MPHHEALSAPTHINIVHFNDLMDFLRDLSRITPPIDAPYYEVNDDSSGVTDSSTIEYVSIAHINKDYLDHLIHYLNQKQGIVKSLGLAFLKLITHDVTPGEYYSTVTDYIEAIDSSESHFNQILSIGCIDHSATIIDEDILARYKAGQADSLPIPNLDILIGYSIILKSFAPHDRSYAHSIVQEAIITLADEVQEAPLLTLLQVLYNSGLSKHVLTKKLEYFSTKSKNSCISILDSPLFPQHQSETEEQSLLFPISVCLLYTSDAADE